MSFDPLLLVIGLALVAVVAVLLLGVGNFAKGGDGKRSNRLMQWRVGMQLAAVVIIVIFVLLRRG